MKGETSRSQGASLNSVPPYFLASPNAGLERGGARFRTTASTGEGVTFMLKNGKPPVQRARVRGRASRRGSSKCKAPEAVCITGGLELPEGGGDWQMTLRVRPRQLYNVIHLKCIKCMHFKRIILVSVYRGLE